MRYFGTARQLPVLPSSGSQQLRLLFIVSNEVTITSFKYGQLTIGTCQLWVDPIR